MIQKLQGLTSQQAQKNLQEWGFNELEDTNKVSPVELIIRQVKKNFILYLLAVSALVSFFVGETYSAYAIIGVIVMIVTITFVQEYKAEKAVEELRKMINPVSIVIRDGKEREIPSREVVPDDIIILRTGEKIPADCVILDQNNILVNESVLTGESKEVKKLEAKDTEQPTDENQLFAGAFVVNGRAMARVLHTGMSTRFGKIVNLISESEKELPLQVKVNTIARYMVIAALIIAVTTGALLFSRVETFTLPAITEILIFLIALSVSAFPEALPVVLMTSLAAGASRMAQKNAIVNRMSIIETLGETTVICSDKTGTITTGEMTVRKIYIDGTHHEIEGIGYNKTGSLKHSGGKEAIKKDVSLQLFLKASVYCNDAKIDEVESDDDFDILGTPTEAALMVMASRAGVYRDDVEYERLEEIPFNSSRKMMSVLVAVDDTAYVFAKGAPEVLLRKCEYIMHEGKKIKLTDKYRDELLATNLSLTKDAYRSLALAYKEQSDKGKDYSEEHMVFLGLAAMEDSPREGVKEAIETCRQAGIETKMITGDNKETAIAIASRIGLEGAVLTGDDLESMTDDELARVVKNTVIFARVQPEHKVRIVKALKQIGETVTMTGDGVNDAPALKDAHVGVAMGKNGTDVSRSVADLTLKDDHFVTIVEAIREGRTIFNNIRKFVSYLLSVTYAELIILFIGVLLAPVLGWITPIFVALQILFMNLVTDDFPAITLGFNKSSKDVMREKPRRDARILNKEIFLVTLGHGILMGGMTLAVHYLSFNILGATQEVARTTALLTLILLEIANAFNFRSFRYQILTRSPFTNPYLFYASMISIVATLLIMYTPLNHVFETAPIGVWDWYIAIVTTLIFIFIVDELKQINNRKNLIELS